MKVSIQLHATSKQLTVTLGLPHGCVCTHDTRVLMICEDLNMMIITDDIDRSMTAQSVEEWLMLWTLVSNYHWGPWGPLSILSNACSIGHQFSHGVQKSMIIGLAKEHVTVMFFMYCYSKIEIFLHWWKSSCKKDNKCLTQSTIHRNGHLSVMQDNLTRLTPGVTSTLPTLAVF